MKENFKRKKNISDLVWFYDISTIVGYSVLNSVFADVKYLILNLFWRYTQFNDQTDLFLTIQFSLGQQS